MSIITQARTEMTLAGFPEPEIVAVERILTIFFDTWDSGGAVWAMAPVLQRLIKGTCLTPLTGADDEWMDVSEFSGGPMWQNKRCSTVFKDPTHAYDIDTPGRPAITFPYDPQETRMACPVIEFDTGA